jgi:DHA2 family multidrug resistance protein-like MFS transporter
MAVILLGITLTMLDATVVNLALPDIARELHASPSAAVWVVNAYQLATLTLLLPCAQLGERLGYRRVYLWGLVVFLVGSLACALAPTLPALVAARALQGLGAAGAMSVNSALVRLTYPRAVLGRGIALNSAVVATASVAGPSVAALVLSVASWPWLFLIQLPLGIAVLLLGRKALPFNSTVSRALPPARIDVLMNVVMFAFVFLGADALGARHGGSGRAGLLAGAALLAAGMVVGWIYVRRQARHAEPLFPVDLLRMPAFALSICTSITGFAAQTLAFIVLPFLLLESQGRTHLQAGLLITAWPVTIVLVAPVAGRLITRFRPGLLAGIGLAILAVGMTLLATMPHHASGLEIACRLVLCGLGFGLFQSPNNHTIVTTPPLRRAGAASGMLGTARLTGQSLGAVIVGVIFSTAGARDGGAEIAFAAAALLAALAAVFSLLKMRT